MKKQFLFSLFLAAFFIISSCTKPESLPNNSNPSTIVKQGTWRVTLFNDNGTIKTSNFSGYNFTFGSTGVVTVSGPSSVTGSWSSFTDSGKQKFDMNFGAITNFNQLNEDWEVTSQSASRIELKHVSGGDGGISYLTIEKN